MTIRPILKQYFSFYIILFCVIIKSFGGTIPFITTWKTDNPGVSASNQITIPTYPGEIYNYTVNWGDGTPVTTEIGNATHTYATPGIYTVSITGNFPRIYFDNVGDKEKILTINQWGNNQWISMASAFNGCINLQGNFVDSPDLTNVTNVSGMFENAIVFNHGIGNWDVGSVTNMSGMFANAIAFNYDIGNWDVSNVTNMSGMFYGARSFNQDIGNWDVSNVVNMSEMFNTTIFNQDIGNWNVGKVTEMNSMFLQATSFNQDIGDWDVSSVVNMSGMFLRATSFNQDIGNWNVSSVTDMEGMFWESTSFNQDIGNWNVGKVTNMGVMFAQSTSFNQNIGNWDVSNVVNMRMMFFLAPSFNQDIGNWNVGKVTDMNYMFSGSTSFNQDIGNWAVSSVDNMSGMFYGASSFNQDIGNWNVVNVTNMSNMFDGVKLSVANYDALLIGWNSKNLQNNVPFSGGLSQYCSGKSSKENMISNDNWIITDGGEVAATSTLNAIADKNISGSFTFPAITGTNLTGNEAYYSGTSGTGKKYKAGDIVNYSEFPSYPVTIYIYDTSGGCVQEKSFKLTITTNTLAPPAPVVNPQVYLCQSSTASPLTATALPGHTLIWYGTAATGGIPSAAAPTPSTSTVGSTTYYVSQTLNSVESTRAAIVVNVVADVGGLIKDLTCDPDQIQLPGDRNSSVFFDWSNDRLNPLNNYTYTYTIKGEAPVTGTTINSSLQVDRLQPGQTVTITLSRTFYPCVPTTAPYTCTVPCGAAAVTPDFPDKISFFLGDSAPVLQSTSPNGIKGVWSPTVVSNTESGSYLFTPDSILFPCAEPKTLNVTILPSAFPVFNEILSIVCQGDTPPLLSLPIKSDDSTPITGTWTPSVVSTSILGPSNYTFYPDPGQNVSVSPKAFTITVKPINTLTSATWTVSEPFSDNQVVTIKASKPGNYLYQLVSKSGGFITKAQTSPIFKNVSFGEYNVIISDPDECSAPITRGPILVVDYPKYFTPNGDNENETWNINSLTNSINAKIFIFDHYGKLLKEMRPNDSGWDGRYNGEPMPANDYWFILEYFDEQNSKQIIKSHITLIR